MSEGDSAYRSDGAPGGDQQGDACPICGEPASKDDGAFPFCSSRCRLIDLGNWLDEAYVVTRPLEQRDLEEGD